LGLVVYTPIELLKVRAQVQRKDYIHYRVEISKLFRNEGIAGLYKGFWPLLLRDIPGWGVYFWFYEVMKRHFNLTHLKAAEMNWSQLLTLMLAGGLAGQVCWVSSYPFDIVKTLV
jgi:solute carrier family 25 (mitochondrial carnitine/acylcarnitine transporter), member 20/29